MPKGGARAGAGRKPLTPGEPTTQVSIRLTEAHLEQLKRIGGGNLSEGIRRLLYRYDTLIAMWQRNVTSARNAEAAARYFEADPAPFEAMVEEARGKLTQLEYERAIITNSTPST